VHRLVKILKESRKIQARLVNGWKLYVWEHVTPSIRRYAYHISKGNELIINVLESKEMVLEEILGEVEKMMKDM
jgi:hypothetical protein